MINFKGSSGPSHFTFEINVGKRRIRHGTTLNLNDKFPDRLAIKNRYPPLSDIDFKNCLSLSNPLNDILGLKEIQDFDEI